jgi:hypothetical protein
VILLLKRRYVEMKLCPRVLQTSKASAEFIYDVPMRIVFWITVVSLEVFVCLAVLVVWRFTVSHRFRIAGRRSKCQPAVSLPRGGDTRPGWHLPIRVRIAAPKSTANTDCGVRGRSAAKTFGWRVASRAVRIETGPRPYEARRLASPTVAGANLS